MALPLCGPSRAGARRLRAMRAPHCAPLGAGTQRVERELAAAFRRARAPLAADVARRARDPPTSSRPSAARGRRAARHPDGGEGARLPAGDAGGRAGRRRALHLPDFPARPSAPSAAGAVAGPRRSRQDARRGVVQPVRPTTRDRGRSRQRRRGLPRARAPRAARGRLPPYTRLATLLFSGTDETKVEALARGSRRRSRRWRRRPASRSSAGGPGAGRLRGRHRWHLLLKAGSAARLHDVALRGPRARRIGLRVRAGYAPWADVDPVDVL